MTRKPDLLQAYRVDRADGITARGGRELLVILVLKTGGVARSFAISRADAAMIGQQLLACAMEVQADVNKT